MNVMSFLTSLFQSAERVLQRPPWLLQETALRYQDRLWTRQQPLLTLAAHPANHRGEGRGQGEESGKQLGVEDGHI